MAFINAIGDKSITLKTGMWDSSPGAGGAGPGMNERQTFYVVSVLGEGTRNIGQEGK